MNDLNLLALAHALPIYAEEGAFHECIAETQLLNVVADVETTEGGKAALAVVRRLFETLCLLDNTELEQGNWAFVSFPAYLLGRSLLEAMSASGQTLFEAGYWNQTGHPSRNIVEEQRQLLAQIEARRIQFHPTGDAAPIRVVYVAWGVIRLGGDFLLVHREDKKRSDAKNYVFPGGRLNLTDLPAQHRHTQSLRALHEGDIALAALGLESTLKRELAEELNLRSEIDYRAASHYTLQPYRKLEGALNNHAYTQYHITLSSIQLTHEGEARLLDRVSCADGLAWFDLDDMLSPQGRLDGNAAFIDALRNEFPRDLRDFLGGMTDSSGTPYRLTGETNAVDIPAVPCMPFRAGKTGKEKDLLNSLNVSELALLWSLVAHARGMSLQVDESRIKLLSGGWIVLASAEATATACSLVNKLAGIGLSMVQMVADTYVRVAIDPSITYFAESAFRYRLDDRTLHLSLALTTQIWAANQCIEKSLPLDPTLTLALRAIQKNGRLWNGDNLLEGKDFDRELREKLDKPLRALGLRKLVRIDRENYVIGVPSGDYDKVLR
jgi:8-oxo-dGTP pyrophosphatase MutT (NUDIX family)